MGKTKRRNPAYMSEDDRWMRKGGYHKQTSRKREKQEFLQEIEDYESGR